jgi:hypothetical protein
MRGHFAVVVKRAARPLQKSAAADEMDNNVCSLSYAANDEFEAVCKESFQPSDFASTL